MVEKQESEREKSGWEGWWLVGDRSAAARKCAARAGGARGWLGLAEAQLGLGF